MPDRPFLNRDDVAAIGGVEPKTISQHLYESQVEIGADKRDGKFADDPSRSRTAVPGARRGGTWSDATRSPPGLSGTRAGARATASGGAPVRLIDPKKTR